MPKVRQDARRNRWIEDTDSLEKVPHRPDAFFTLRFQNKEGTPDRLAHFFYEADRTTMTMRDIRDKLRGYFYFIKKYAKHRDIYGAHPIRAVLIETLNDSHYQKLRALLQDGSICTEGRTGLFWLTVSTYEHEEADKQGAMQRIIKRMTSPELILKRVWSLAVDDTLHSLLDAENSI